MTDERANTPKPKVVREKMRRPVKPGTLLLHILDYQKTNEIGLDDPIQALVDNLRDDIVSEDLAKARG